MERTEKLIVPSWKKTPDSWFGQLVWEVKGLDWSWMKCIENTRIPTMKDICRYTSHYRGIDTLFLTSELLSITGVVIVTGQDKSYVISAINALGKIFLLSLLRSVVSENLRRTAFYSSTNNRRTQRQFIRNRYIQELCLLFAYVV